MYADGLRAAWNLLTGFDPRIFSALRVTLLCSVASTAIAGLAGIPLALLLRRGERGWRRAALVAARTGMACPTVVVGLLLYGLFSRSGSLGDLGILYTPAAIIAGEFLLALPVVVAFATQGLDALDPRLERTALTLGAGRLRLSLALLREARPALVAALLGAFGRVVSELGVAVMLGGNIEGWSRTLTTTIALETQKGFFGLALAVGAILLLFALSVNLVASIARPRAL